MLKFKKNNKRKIFLLIVFLVIIIGTMGIVYVHLVSKNIEVKFKDVTVESLQNNSKYGFEDYFNENYNKWAISTNEYENMVNNPSYYRVVSYELNVTNNTKFIKLYADNCTPTLGYEIQNLIVGYYDSYVYREFPDSYEPNGLTRKRYVNIIVKCNGKTDEEIIESAKKSSFLFTGHGYWFDTEFDQNPHTEQYSIDVKSLN